MRRRQVRCAPLPASGKLRCANLLLLFRMKPTSLGFHSEEQLFSEKDESSERFAGLRFNTPCCLFRLAPTAAGIGDISPINRNSASQSPCRGELRSPVAFTRSPKRNDGRTQFAPTSDNSSNSDLSAPMFVKRLADLSALIYNSTRACERICLL